MIYGFDYGSELSELIGREESYALAAAPAMVEEALLKEEGIQAVEDVAVSQTGEGLAVSFKIVTGWGNIEGQGTIR